LYLLPYQALLGLHLLAVALFLAGFVITGLSLPSWTRGPLTPGQHEALHRLRSMNSLISTPALAFVWLFGGWMALQAGWYEAGWLQWKVILVAILSLLHFQQGRTLKRLDGGAAVRAVGLRALAASLLVVAFIATLVIAKPDLPPL